MAIIQDIVNFVPSWQKHLDESGYLKAPGQTDYHQKAGYNFKENFPNTPGYVADALGKAYQYGTEGIGSFFSGSSFPDAMARAKEESRLNSLGFRGQGFNMDEYNQTMDFARKGFDQNTGLTYGAAQASELTDLERDFPGMSTGDIIESMNNRPQNLGFIEEAPQIKEAIYQDRIMNNNLPSYGYKPRQGILQGLQNKIGSGLGSIKDFAIDKGTQGFNLGKMALSGIGNAIMPGLGFVLSNLKPEPLFRETLANSRKANPLGTRGVGPNGVQLDGVSDFGGFTTDDLGRITNNGLNYNTPEGIMSGYNAGFDLAGKALGRIGKLQDLMARDPKSKFQQDRMKKINNLKTAAVASAQAKRQAYQDKIDRAKNEAAANRARAKSITAGYGGHDDRPGATGPTAAGAGMGVGGGYASDYGFLKDGGMIGYRNGGLASMFTRRG